MSIPVTAEEPTTLRAFLDHYRDTRRRQADGLTDEQLHARLGPSTLTLGGLLKYARHCGHADLIRESIDGAVDL